MVWITAQWSKSATTIPKIGQWAPKPASTHRGVLAPSIPRGPDWPLLNLRVVPFQRASRNSTIDCVIPRRANLLRVNLGRSDMSIERIALAAIAIAALAYGVSQISKPQTAVAATTTTSNVEYSIGASAVTGQTFGTWILDQTHSQAILCTRDINSGSQGCTALALPAPAQ